MPENVVVLLTGTVIPRDMSFTKLQDPEKRRGQYVHAIEFWRQATTLPIVFVENSGFDLAPFIRPDLNHNLEFLTFDGNRFPPERGKGYGELMCFAHAHAHSEVVRSADFVFKATGRHRVLNFPSFLAAYRRTPSTQISVDFITFLQFSESRFFGFDPSFIPDYLLRYLDIVDDSKGVFFEHILARAALHAIADGFVFRPLPCLPRIAGTSGTFDAELDSSYLTWLQKNAKFVLKQRMLK